jgi:hypothetical protein
VYHPDIHQTATVTDKWSGWGMKLTSHLHLVLRWRMHGAVPPLPQYVFMVWCLVKAQGQLYLLQAQTEVVRNVVGCKPELMLLWCYYNYHLRSGKWSSYWNEPHCVFFLILSFVLLFMPSLFPFTITCVGSLLKSVILHQNFLKSSPGRNSSYWDFMIFFIPFMEYP